MPSVQSFDAFSDISVNHTADVQYSAKHKPPSQKNRRWHIDRYMLMDGTCKIGMQSCFHFKSVIARRQTGIDRTRFPCVNPFCVVSCQPVAVLQHFRIRIPNPLETKIDHMSWARQSDSAWWKNPIMG